MCSRGAKGSSRTAYGRRVTSSRLEPPTRNPGAHRARRRAHRAPSQTSSQRMPARYEAYLDGLFTYCLSVLCDHEAATEVLGDVLAISEHRQGRCPSADPGRKAWLYALARWTCLRRLAERRKARQGAHTGRPAAKSAGARSAEPQSAEPQSAESEAVAEHRRRELAQLAWPEAAGTTPEQREALELAVRHGLAPREVASVLGLDHAAARELLASGACEVERTRAALAVVELGGCPTISRLTGDHQVLLSAALRRELVRHVDDCPRCRRAAERAGAGGPWPGATVTPPAALPLVEAPRAAAYVAMTHVPRARVTGPRFDRTGFPVDPKDRAARRERLRTRAVTTTVVATVVAAPVLALWAAYRGAPLTGEARAGAGVSATEADDPKGLDGDSYSPYENAGNAARTDPAPRFTAGSRTPDVSVEVISQGKPQTGPGRLTVAARPSGGTTVVTLTASGGAPVDWSLWTDAPWLTASRTSGTLAPGETITVYVMVNRAREPVGAWSARIGVEPSGAVIRTTGWGASPEDPDPGPDPEPPDPTPTETESPSPEPPDPTPTETESPSPEPPDPTPTETESPSPEPPDPTPTDSETPP
ncbi:hypothetical protein [Streptomyces sp. NPDC050504]|uniref:BACON domain-containing protein n=1 Tax=Streptomyces sp. NPDC050504 TaxID=3365618 RepID=UPI00379454B2